MLIINYDEQHCVRQPLLIIAVTVQRTILYNYVRGVGSLVKSLYYCQDNAVSTDKMNILNVKMKLIVICEMFWNILHIVKFA